MPRTFVALFLPVFVLCACRPAMPLDLTGDSPEPLTFPKPSTSETTPTPLPPTPAKAPELSSRTIRGIEFEGVAFDARSHRLLVIDQPQGPGSAFNTARDAAAAHGALAALNAGFFTPEGKPLGLVITNGRRFGVWNSASSLGSGIFAESSSGQLSISRRVSPSAFQDARELMQAGPLLVENGGAIGGLDAGKSAVRSILLTDGGTRWWIGRTSLCSLSALGKALASGSPAPWPVHHALNLDGGRSTDFFVSTKIPGGPLERRGLLNRPVRNFLILKPR